MASFESPAGARRRVRLALREAREARELTQGQVAEAMEWSLSKVMRIESGDVTISLNDLRPLLAYLGITDRAVVDRLVQDSRISRRRKLWYDDPRFREHLTPALRQLIQYEAEATAARYFYTMIVPGRLQTDAYADAILNSYRGELSEADIEVRREVRVRRRDQLLEQKDACEIFVLMDESVLRRKVGGAYVLADQLTYLIRLIREQRLRLAIRVVPFTLEAPAPLFGAFEILNLAGNGENSVMYRESHLTDELVEDRTKVDHHRHLFEVLWNAALDEATSQQLIHESAKSVRANGGAVERSTAHASPPRRSRDRKAPG